MEKLCLFCKEPYHGKGDVHPRCYQKYYHKNRRDKIIAHYGGKCQSCHKDTNLVLTYKNYDNPMNLTGSGLYTWIINNNYPDEFEVLCQTCLYLKIVDLNEPRKQETILRHQMREQARLDLLDMDRAFSSDPVDFKRRRKRRY